MVTNPNLYIWQLTHIYDSCSVPVSCYHLLQPSDKQSMGKSNSLNNHVTNLTTVVIHLTTVAKKDSKIKQTVSLGTKILGLIVVIR
ncbi:hypothetical protein E2320_001984 [Naja naja]|nr:hypothetical protein E2320_001984 [Naja naja]